MFQENQRQHEPTCNRTGLQRMSGHTLLITTPRAELQKGQWPFKHFIPVCSGIWQPKLDRVALFQAKGGFARFQNALDRVALFQAKGGFARFQNAQSGKFLKISTDPGRALPHSWIALGENNEKLNSRNEQYSLLHARTIPELSRASSQFQNWCSVEEFPFWSAPILESCNSDLLQFWNHANSDFVQQNKDTLPVIQKKKHFHFSLVTDALLLMSKHSACFSVTAADGNFVALPYYKSKLYATHKTCASSAQEYSANLTRMNTLNQLPNCIFVNQLPNCIFVNQLPNCIFVNQLPNCIFAIFVPASFTQNMLKTLPFEQKVITLHTGFFFFFLFVFFLFEVNFADCIHSWTCTEWSTGRWTAELGITMVIVTQIIPNYIALVQAFNWKQREKRAVKPWVQVKGAKERTRVQFTK